MPNSKSFLHPDPEQIRHQIRGILDSYTHDWDIFAELAQNSVDAIAKAEPARGHIKIVIDAISKSVEFADNGTGINPAEIEKLLRPFATNKVGMTNQIGQKGVGLTFILFSSNSFELESHHTEGARVAKIEGARSWLDTESESDLLLYEERTEPSTLGTKIKIRLATNDHPIFDLTFEELMFAIRTRTALGNTSFIWGEDLNCDFELIHIDKSGNKKTESSPCKYLLPIDGLKDQDVISFDSYVEWRSDGDRSDQEKRRRLKDKIVFRQGKSYQAGRDIKYWTCFVPGRAVWQKLSEIHGLSSPEDESGILADEMFFQYALAGGIYTSTKGMPTGILLELKPRGAAGYVPNFFMLLEDPSLSFDIGRKAIQSRQQGMLRQLAYDQFKAYLNTVVKYVSGSIDEPDPLFDREERFAEIRKLPDLDSTNSVFVKRPDSQEATVAGMFFEQLGKGTFSNFSPLISGYKGRYDLYGQIGNRSFVVEFKFDLSGLFRDFSDERKMFNEVDLVVVWDITEKDRKVISNRGLTISEIAAGLINPDASRFSPAHYKLHIDGVKSVEVLCMRKLLKPDE